MPANAEESVRKKIRVRQRNCFKPTRTGRISKRLFKRLIRLSQVKEKERLVDRATTTYFQG